MSDSFSLGSQSPEEKQAVGLKANLQGQKREGVNTGTSGHGLSDFLSRDSEGQGLAREFKPPPLTLRALTDVTPPTNTLQHWLDAESMFLPLPNSGSRKKTITEQNQYILRSSIGALGFQATEPSVL